MIVYGHRFLKISLPDDLAERLRGDYWRTFAPMMDYWDGLPISRQIGAFERRCAGFDLSADPAWVCIEVNFFEDVSDETLMLLKLKYDLSETQHLPREPVGGWQL